jgi:hypothetical protein
MSGGEILSSNWSLVWTLELIFDGRADDDGFGALLGATTALQVSSNRKYGL